MLPAAESKKLKTVLDGGSLLACKSGPFPVQDPGKEKAKGTTVQA